MVMAEYTPDRGDLVWITLNPQAGHEQSGRRPALILSPLAYNKKTGLAICCPVTNQIKSYPFEVIIPENLPVTGVILSDHVKNLDWVIRKAEFICSVPEEIILEVLKKLRSLL